MPLPKLLRYFILILLSVFYQTKGYSQSRLIQEQLRGLPNIKDSTVLVNQLNRLGMLYLSKNFDSSFYYSGKAKAIATRLHYYKGETDADNVTARVFSMRGLSKESLELYSRVLSAYRQQLDTVNLAPAMMSMAMVYMGLADSTRAWALCRQAVQMGSKLKRDSTMGMVYAYYPLFMGLSADSTDYYLNKSREIAVRYKDEQMLIVNMQRQAARLLDNTDRRPELLHLINQSLAAARKAGLIQNEFISLNYYAYYYQKDADKVLKIHQQAYKLMQKRGYGIQDSYYLKIILHFTELTGNKDEIIRIHGLLVKAFEEDIVNLKKFTGDYIKYNSIQQDNTLLTKENELKTGYLITVIVSLVIVVFVLLAVWLNRKRLAVLNKKISMQNTDMQTALTALEQSQDENTRIMKIVAHDLRSPMAATISIAELLLDNDHLLPEDKEMLGLMKTSSLHSLDMITDLLNMNTTSEGLKKELVEMHTLLHYCVNLLKFKAIEKKQEIELETQQIVITVNREKIWRVVSNMIVNAIKFSPEGSVIRVKMKKEGEMVQISIQDEGIGIPENLKDKIFTMFTDARRSGTSGEQSFGLGLAISRQIVEAHGGKIWFESNAGNGTTFYVELLYKAEN